MKSRRACAAALKSASSTLILEQERGSCWRVHSASAGEERLRACSPRQKGAVQPQKPPNMAIGALLDCCRVALQHPLMQGAASPSSRAILQLWVPSCRAAASGTGRAASLSVWGTRGLCCASRPSARRCCVAARWGGGRAGAVAGRPSTRAARC